MKRQFKFFPASFPVFGQEWFDLTRPYLEAYLKVKNAYEITQRHSKHQRMIRWFKKQREILEQIDLEVADCTDELEARLFLREMADASVHLDVPPKAMLSVVALILYEAKAALRSGIFKAEAAIANPRDDEEAERRRGTLLRGVAASRCRGVMKPEIRICCDWLDTWIRTADQRHLRRMMVSFPESEIAAAICREGGVSEAIATDQMDELRRRLEVLRTEQRRLKTAYNEVSDRLDRTIHRILAPYDAVATSVHPWGILPLLVDVQTGDMAAAMRPIESEEPAYEMILQPDRAPFLETACIDPMFWYIGLTSLLRSSGAMLGYGLKKWAVELLAGLLRHPKRLREVTVPDEGMRTRSVLIKWIAPIVKGHSGNEQVAAKMLELGPGRSDEGLLVFTCHLATASARPDKTIGYRNDDHRRTAEFLWTQILGPATAEILQWMASGIEISGDVLAALKEEAEQSEESLKPAASVPVELLEPDEGAPAGVPETWYYATNPEAAMLNLIPVTMPADSRDTAFTDFLRSQGIPTLIKPSSILHALEYFRDMPPITRAVTPYDDMGTQRWHKIKRGALRIFARIEPDSRLLFHVMARRDWRADLIAYARRAA